MKQLLLIWTGIANGTSMITRRSIRSSLAALFVATIFSTTPLFAQEQGNDSPVGISGIFTAITTAGLYDPNVGNMQRQIDDIVVPGSVGAYPLKWTRYWNSHTSFHDGDGVGASWRFSYLGYSHTTGWKPNFPDGRKLTGAYGVEEGAGAIPTDQLSSYGITYPGHVGEMIYLNDGGRVILEGIPSGGFFAYHPIQIKDPYGQTTTLTWSNISGTNPGTLNRITEPGGRYLQLTYDSTTYHLIKVEAYDGVNSQPTQWVTYHWIAGTLPSEFPQPNDVIDQVTYSDGTVANYTYADGKYIGPCVPYGYPRTHWHAPLLVTADDPHYPGPMRQIAYTYNTDVTNQTRIVSENHAVSSGGQLTVGEAVSTIAGVSTGVNGIGTTTATERRGDGATRTLHYHSVSYCPDCPPPSPEPPDCIPRAPLDGKLLDFTDFLGHTTTLTYESDETKPSAGFITAVTDPNGHTTQYTRSSASWGILKVTHPDGSSVEQTFTDEANPYYLASRTLQHGPNDSVQTINYTRDGSNRITRKDYPHDADEPVSYETFTYNNFGEVLAHRLASGGTESFQYDGRGLKTSYTDALGSGPGDPAHTTTYSYYTTGPWTDRLQTVTHPANASGLHATETYEYDRDGSGNPTAGRGLVTKVTYADGSTVTKTYNKYGDVLTSTDELGHTATFMYDDYGRLLTTTDPLNNVTTNSYVPTNQSSSYVTTSKLPFSTTLPSGKRTTLEYDANWRKTFTHVAPGTPDAATSQNVYDEGVGNIGHLTSTIDPRNNKTTYAYDVRDRQISTTDPLNHTTSWTFDLRGNKATETHANGEVITFDQYDAMNRLRQQTVHRDASTMDVTHSTYDAGGNLDTHTDENGNVYDYDYDTMNRPTQVTYPNAKTEIHSYDAAGNIQTYTNRAGATQAFSYDNRNRQTNFTWTDGTSHQTTTYDAASRKTEIDNDDATIGFTYDNDNRLTSQVEKAITTGVGDNVARTVTYTYDADGNRKTIQYPSGTAFNYTYTNRNQVASINPGLSGGTPIVSYQFDASGNITNRTLDNGTATAYTVDAANRDASILHGLASSATKRFDYAYNNVNDITAVDRNQGAADENGDTYAYDLTQQITGFTRDGTGVNLSAGTMTGGTAKNMTFDGCGNEKSLNRGGVFQVNNLNEYTTFNGVAVGNDTDGNVQTYNGWTYTYDAQNRLRQASNATQGVTESFYYDGLNRQVARVLTGGGSSTPTPTPTPTPTATPTPSSTPTPTPTSTPTSTPTPTPTPGQQCSPVTINDSNNSSRQITMSTTTSGATIFYTTDGTTPTHNAGTATGSTLVYTAAITAPNCQNTVYTALAYKSGYLDSNTTNHTAKYLNGFGCGGMMMMSVSQSSTTIFSVWDGDWAILEEYTTGNVLVEKYLHGYHGLVKTFINNVYYYQDELGSTSHIANASGALLEYYKYDLYGKPTYWNAATPSSQLQASAYGVKDLGNGGARWMPELGLYDDRNRFMSPDLGRFLQPDPIGFKGDASNLYRYCGNDWANKTDPTGLEGNPPPEGPNLIGFEREMAQDRALASQKDNHTFQEKWSGDEVKSQANVDSQHAANMSNARAESRQAAREVEAARRSETITVSVYTGGIGFGHIGIGVDSTRTEGLYPAHEETWRDKAKIGAGNDVPATVHEDTRRRTDTITIHVTSQQADNVRNYVTAARPPNSGMYNFYGRNCARFVEGALRTGQVRSSDTMYPHVLMRDLHTRYDNE